MNGKSPDVNEGTGASNKLECAVCVQPCVQPVQLPCRHIFCFLCIKGFSQQNGNKCAMCREAFPPDFCYNPKLVTAQQSSVIFEGSYQWFYEGCNGWWQYDDRTSVIIEDAYQKGELECEVMIAGIFYIIDFEQNLQKRRSDASCRRRIKRDLVTVPKKGVAGIYVSPQGGASQNLGLDQDVQKQFGLLFSSGI